MPSSNSEEDPKIPVGLESDPIALFLRSKGLPVTRAAWCMASYGENPSDLEQTDPETAGMLDRMFPNPDESSTGSDEETDEEKDEANPLWLAKQMRYSKRRASRAQQDQSQGLPMPPSDTLPPTA